MEPGCILPAAPHQLHPPPLLPPRPRPPVSATQNLCNLSVICCLLIGCSYHERDVALKHWSNSPHVCVLLYIFSDELVFFYFLYGVSLSLPLLPKHLLCTKKRCSNIGEVYIFLSGGLQSPDLEHCQRGVVCT